MALAFLTTEDLTAGMIDKFINERTDENPTAILEAIEKKKIALIKAKLSGRFDTDMIFDAVDDQRDYLIVDILTKLCLYEFIRRNAARKVPEDYIQDWNWANKQLDMIASGKLAPDSLPIYIEENGEESSFFDNNYNTDWNI